MRILNLQEFLQVPKGTFYMKYEPCIFGPLCIFEGSAGNIDFFYIQFNDAIDFNESGELWDHLEEARVDSSISLKMDYDIVSRDGLFEEDQMFAILEEKDVEELLLKIFNSFLYVYTPLTDVNIQKELLMSCIEFIKKNFSDIVT